MFHFRVLSTMAEGGAENKRFAENNGSFIRDALIDIKDNTGMTALDFDYLQDIENITNKKGIYTFYVSLGENDNYPVYIGKTEKGIKARILEHKNPPNGVIYRFENEKHYFQAFDTKQNPPRLRVWMLELETPCIMKFAESMFLMAFDFALNSAENSSTRRPIRNINKNTPKESYIIFKRVQDRLHRECEEIKVKEH